MQLLERRHRREVWLPETVLDMHLGRADLATGRVVDRYGNVGTILGAPASIGPEGLAFDGTDDRIAISDAAALRIGTGDFQIHVWGALPATQEQDFPVLVAKGRDAAGQWYFRLHKATGHLQFKTADINAISTVSSLDAKVHLFSAIRDGTVDQARIYVDKVQAGEDLTAATDLNSAVPVEIGCAHVDANRYLTGNIRRVIIARATQTFAQAERSMVALWKRGW